MAPLDWVPGYPDPECHVIYIGMLGIRLRRSDKASTLRVCSYLLCLATSFES